MYRILLPMNSPIVTMENITIVEDTKEVGQCYIFVNTLETFILQVDHDSILIAQPLLYLPLL